MELPEEQNPQNPPNPPNPQNKQAARPEYTTQFSWEKFNGNPEKLEIFLKHYKAHATACRWTTEGQQFTYISINRQR